MTNAILKNTIADNADNTAAAAIQAGFASLNTNLASVNAGLQSLTAANGDILRALKTGRSNPRGCGCCGCCCCGGGNAAVSNRDTVYAMGNDSKNVDGKTVVALTSYHQPITSQAEADAVNVIVYLGGLIGGGLYFGVGFTLDGFAMPGDLPIYLAAVDSYPCTFLRKQDRSGWICLTRQDVMHPDWNSVDIYITRSIFNAGMDYLEQQEQLCCGLYEHNCRGKFFTAQIADGDYWTEEQKEQSPYLTVKKDTIFYDSFPENPNPQIGYSSLLVCKDCNSYDTIWGDLIEKFGDKPFGVRIDPNANLRGIAFTLN